MHPLQEAQSKLYPQPINATRKDFRLQEQTEEIPSDRLPDSTRVQDFFAVVQQQ